MHISKTSLIIETENTEIKTWLKEIIAKEFRLSQVTFSSKDKVIHTHWTENRTPFSTAEGIIMAYRERFPNYCLNHLTLYFKDAISIPRSETL